MLEVTSVPIGDLARFEHNPRKGDVDAIAESLQTNGQYKPITVNRGTHTGRAMEVLAGNHTVAAAEQIGLDTIDVVIIDVDEATAARIVLADNRTSDLAEYDDQALLDLLQSLDGDLEGTGYEDVDVDHLEATLAAVTADVDRKATSPVVAYNIIFDTELQQERWYAWLRLLKERYPDLDTLADRLMEHIDVDFGRETAA